MATPTPSTPAGRRGRFSDAQTWPFHTPGAAARRYERWNLLTIIETPQSGSAKFPTPVGKYPASGRALSKLLTVRFGSEERSPAPDVGTGGTRGSTRFEAMGMVDFGYCPPSGKRP